MIEIKCAAPDTAALLCARAGVTAQTVLVMTERDDLLGFACLSQNGEEVDVCYLEAPDIPLTDALLRAALNTARAKGAVFAAVSHEPLALYMAQKGYFPELPSTHLKIADFFAKSVCKA